MNQPTPDATPARAERTPCWPTVVVVGLFLAVAVPMIVTQHDRGRGRFDQVNYHEPAIYRFAEQLPTPDVSNYLSATTPAYHLILAVVSKYISESLVILQLVGMLATVGLLTLLVRWLTPRAGPAQAAVLGLAFVSSLYVFSAGVHLLPDNMAWLGVLACLLIALRPRFDAVTLIGGGAVLLVLVLTRQSHLWAAGPLLAAAWLGSAFAGDRSPIREVGGLLGELPSRLGRTAVMALAILPAFGAVWWFSRIWGGLTVPIYHDYMQGPNPATPAIVLAQLAVIAVFHAGYLIVPAWRLVRTKPVTVALVILAGLAVAVIPETTYDPDSGRYSGLWNIANKAPDLAGRTNSLLLVLVPAGAVALAVWVSAVGARSRWVLLAAAAGFTAAVTMTFNAWVRYHEPFLLLFSAIGSGLIVLQERSDAGDSADRDAGRPGSLLGLMRLAGPAVLALLLAAVTVLKSVTEDRVIEPKRSQPSISTPLSDLWPQRWPRLERLGIDPAGPALQPGSGSGSGSGMESENGSGGAD